MNLRAICRLDQQAVREHVALLVFAAHAANGRPSRTRCPRFFATLVQRTNRFCRLVGSGARQLPELAGRLGKSPPTARALAIESFSQSREGGRLRKGHNRSECQWRTVRVMAIRDPTDGMPQDLHGGLGDMLVVVRRAGLAEVL